MRTPAEASQPDMLTSRHRSRAQLGASNNKGAFCFIKAELSGVDVAPFSGSHSGDGKSSRQALKASRFAELLLPKEVAEGRCSSCGSGSSSSVFPRGGGENLFRGCTSKSSSNQSEDHGNGTLAKLGLARRALPCTASHNQPPGLVELVMPSSRTSEISAQLQRMVCLHSSQQGLVSRRLSMHHRGSKL